MSQKIIHVSDPWHWFNLTMGPADQKRLCKPFVEAPDAHNCDSYAYMITIAGPSQIINQGGNLIRIQNVLFHRALP